MPMIDANTDNKPGVKQTGIVKNTVANATKRLRTTSWIVMMRDVIDKDQVATVKKMSTRNCQFAVHLNGVREEY